MTKEIKDYIDEKIIQKKHSPSILLDFINDRFKTNIGYKEILNYISKKNKSLFGNSSEEFSNFINLLNEMKNCTNLNLSRHAPILPKFLHSILC